MDVAIYRGAGLGCICFVDWAMFLLYVLIRKNAATHVSSVMYLTPAVTSLMAWLLFDEALTFTGALGMIVVALGVAFVIKK